MSDLGLPFDGADADASGDRRKKLIVLAAVAVLLVLAGVLLVPKLLGGDAEPAATPAAGSGNKPAPKAAPTKKPAAKTVKKPKPFNGALARDPFDAPYTPNSEKLKTAAPAAPAGGVPAGGGTTPTGGTTTTPVSHTFTLLAVSGSGNSVTVDVLWDTKTYSDLKIGQRFIEDQFKVVTAASQCASFLYGDREFALCEGEKQSFTGG